MAKTMFLFFVWQGDNTGYDTFSEAVVSAPNEAVARTICPGTWGSDWANSPSGVKVKRIGTYTGGGKSEVIVASFHAG